MNRVVIVQMHIRTIQPHIHMYLFSLNPLPIQAATYHGAECHILYNRSLWVIHFE